MDFCWSCSSISEGDADLWGALLETQPRGSCSCCFRVSLGFTLSTSPIKLVSFCPKEEQTLLSYRQDGKYKACAGPGDMERQLFQQTPRWYAASGWQPEIGPQKIKTANVPARIVACSASLFYLPLIKVKLLLRKNLANHYDLSIWELPQPLFSKVNNDKWWIGDQGTTYFRI